MNYEDLTEEQKAKAQACKTPEEILVLAKEDMTNHRPLSPCHRTLPHSNTAPN